MTYDQAGTIAQTLESIVSQRTGFPIEVIVHDDASQDGTADVVREFAARYPEIVLPIYQTENKYNEFNIFYEFMRPKIRGRYVAVCDGDDVWTDPEKLAVQVAAMESDPGITMCFHAVTQSSPDGDITVRPMKRDCFVPVDKVIRRGGLFCPTVSLMFRRDVFDEWPEFRLMADVYDYPAQILAALRGKVKYIDRIMALYRYAYGDSWTALRTHDTDFIHLNCETNWLTAFNEYTGHKYEASVCFHLSHLWFTEYRKGLDLYTRDQASKYVAKLPLSERIGFRIWLFLFVLLGRRANAVWNFVKKILLN